MSLKIRGLFVIGLIGLAVLFAVAGIKNAVNESSVKTPNLTGQIVCCLREIPEGVAIKAEDVEIREISPPSLAPRASVSEIAAVVGRKAKYGISPMQIISRFDLAD